MVLSLFLVYIPKVLPLLLKLKMFVSMETPHPHVNNGTNNSYFQSYFVQGSCIMPSPRQTRYHYNTTGTQNMKLPGNWRSYICITSEF